MSNSITTLVCPSCGGRLPIKPDTDRITCAYCGNQNAVHREVDGAAHLEPISADVRHIRTTMDRTAAELAIPRLTTELAAVEAQYKAAKATTKYTRPRQTNNEIAFILLAGLVLVFSACSQNLIIVSIALVLAGVSLYMFLKRDKEGVKNRLDTIDELDRQVTDKKAILERTRKIVAD